MRFNQLVFCFSIATLSFSTFAGTMGVEQDNNKFYLGVFGGFAGSDAMKIRQTGIAYHSIGQFFPGHLTPTDENYNLYVDVTGTQRTGTPGMVGLHVGYRGNEMHFNAMHKIGITPLFEIEGYYLGAKMSGTLSNPILEPAVLRPEGTVSETHSVPAYAHRFNDNFSLNTGVLMLNTMFNVDNILPAQLTPYVGVGIGIAFNTLSGANSDQVAPYDENVNHFNTGTRASSSVLSGQTKVGLRKQINNKVSLFAEYRYLHIAPSAFTFGNTYYPGIHPDTSRWNVNLSSMNFQAGMFGIDYAC